MGQKVIIRFRWGSGLSSASRIHLTTFWDLCPTRMFKTVFRDSSLYPKQLHLFCLLMLISASADPIGFIINFCSMNCCPSSKTAVVNIEAFRHLIMC